MRIARVRRRLAEVWRMGASWDRVAGSQGFQRFHRANRPVDMLHNRPMLMRLQRHPASTGQKSLELFRCVGTEWAKDERRLSHLHLLLSVPRHSRGAYGSQVFSFVE